MEEGVVKKLVTSMTCDVCGQFYELDHVDIIGRNKDHWFLKVSCCRCSSQALVAASIDQSRSSKFITDLSDTEIEKFEDMQELTTDEMLDMHNLLKDFRGNFSELFKPT